jgi:predicted RNA-binding Zn-ribbon protein involved in translation (DUF1610 family)
LSQPKILFWDIETSYQFGAFFGRYNININPSNVLHGTYIICAAWSWSDQKKIHSVSVLDDPQRHKKFKYDIRDLRFDDYHVIKTLHDTLMEADLIVAHNGDRFDMKKFMARCIHHGLPPLPYIPTVDTLKATRAIASFDSHSLDELAATLDLNRKLCTEPGLWLNASLGDSGAIKKMVKYCRGDIKPLRELYYLLRPYMKSHPNMGLFKPERHLICPRCGDSHYIRRGKRQTKGLTVKLQYSCKSCGHWFVGKKSIRTVETR